MDLQKIVMNFMSQNMNPFYSNLLNLAQGGKTKELEKIAQNMCSQRNIDYEKAFTQFKDSYAQTINNNFFRR